MTDTKKLSDEAYAIGFTVGLKALEIEKRCNAGMDHNSAESKKFAAELNSLEGMRIGYLLAAKTLLNEDDWQQFVYRSALSDTFEADVEHAKSLIIQPPKQ